MNDLTIDIDKGLYVIAVSGGVDSMALLHLLKDKPNIKLIVAHFDHGIRHDSRQDRELVQDVSRRYKLPFVFDNANLGVGTNEADARKARYQFLNKVKQAGSAQAIITAHHQDDLLETAILNILRGTNRKGLSSLKSTDTIIRPLMSYTKAQIKSYAQANGLVWREDYTNTDLNYKRNYIRHKLIPKLKPSDRNSLVKILSTATETNQQLDYRIKEFLMFNTKDKQLNRHAFTMLPHSVAMEVMAGFLRQNGIREFNAKLLSRLVIAAKTYKVGQRIDVNLEYFLQVNQQNLALTCREC